MNPVRRIRWLLLITLAALAGSGSARAANLVTIEAGRLIYSRAGSTVEAASGVVVTFNEGYAQGVSATYDLATRTIRSTQPVTFRTRDYSGTATWAELDPEGRRGRFFDATITGDDGTLLWGARIEQTGERQFRITEGGFTPCDCPAATRPAWSVQVADATVDWRRRVRFHHARFLAGDVPVLYAPAGILPLPESRQSGLLFPRLGWDRALGWRVRPGAFVAFGPHADATAWIDYASDAGIGPLGELRGVSRSGRYSIGGSWFREFRDAAILYEDGIQIRSASTRWDVAVQARQRIPGGLRFEATGRVVSDQQRDRDFANDLADLTRSSADSRLRLSGTWHRIGAAIARLGISQSLIGSGASGARIPSVRWLVDPQSFGRWPVRLRASLRADRFVQQDTSLGSVWQPAAWLPAAERLVARSQVGTSVDLLPGWFVDADLGGLAIWRDARQWQTATTAPYTVTASNLPAQFVGAGFARVRSEVRLQGRAGRLQQRLHAGTDLNWLRPTGTLLAPVEQLDRLTWETWIVPHAEWRGAISDVTLWWRLDLPLQFDAGLLPDRLIAQQIAASGHGIDLRARLWRDARAQTWPLGEITLRGGPWKQQHVTIGFARRASDATGIAWDVPRGLPEATSGSSATPYREAWASWDWAIWRFYGGLEARRRFPLYPGEPAAWNSQAIRLGYRDPCDCLRLHIGWQNLPGNRGDRVDVRIDFALLGGVGTDDAY